MRRTKHNGKPYVYTEEQEKTILQLIDTLNLCDQKIADLLASIPVRKKREGRIVAARLLCGTMVRYLKNQEGNYERE